MRFTKILVTSCKSTNNQAKFLNSYFILINGKFDLPIFDSGMII